MSMHSSGIRTQGPSVRTVVIVHGLMWSQQSAISSQKKQQQWNQQGIREFRMR